METNASTTAEAAESQEGCQSKEEVMESCPEDKEKIEDSHEEIKEVSENKIKEVIRKKVSYIVANLEYDPKVILLLVTVNCLHIYCHFFLMLLFGF